MLVSGLSEEAKKEYVQNTYKKLKNKEVKSELD